MRLLARKQGARPRAKTIRPAERYLTAGAEQARRLGCSFVGTEHVLLALVHDRASGGAALLGRLGADPTSVESVEELQVRRARELGWSWQQIAALLGVSKQAVHQKFGAAERRPLRRRR